MAKAYYFAQCNMRESMPVYNIQEAIDIAESLLKQKHVPVVTIRRGIEGSEASVVVKQLRAPCEIT